MGKVIMSLGKFCDPVYGLEVPKICLPSACFVRTVIFPIVHWYSWCLRLSHLFTFCANYGPPTSYENLWACLETVETHYNIKEKQRTKYMSFPSTFELSILPHPPASPAHTVHYLCACSYCTAAVGGWLTPTGTSVKYVEIHSAWHYLSVIIGMEEICTLSVLQVVINLLIHKWTWLTGNNGHVR